MYIGDMHFDNRGCDGRYGIADGDRSMGVSAGIENDTIIIKPRSLQFINQFAFDIALIITK